MKRLLHLLLLYSPAHSIAQAGINSNGALPDPRSKLDISSTEKGLLSPRMSASQRDQYRAQFDEWENPRFLSRQQCK